ncbi:MAG: hypothetical protein GX295_06215 [Syntrophomonadaceae bacterium]|nr:hypothetical protein [Syntrophomonadaceae bacterium]
MAKQFEDSYLINLGRQTLAKIDYRVANTWKTSRTGAIRERFSQAYQESRTGHLLSRDLVKESGIYAGLQGLLQKAGLLFDQKAATQTASLGRVYFVLLGIMLLLGSLVPWVLLPWKTALPAMLAFLLAVTILYRVEIGVYAAALLLPFLPFKALLLLSLLTLVSLFIQRWRGRRFDFYFSPTWIPILIFILIAFGATLTSVTFWTSVSELFIPLTGIIFLFLMVCVLNQPQKLDNFMLCLALAGLATAGYAIYQYYHGPGMEYLNVQWVDPSQTQEIKNRAYAVFENPNLLAQYLVLLTPLSLGALLATRIWWRKLLLGLTALVGIFCLLLTFSRGGWLAMIAALLVFAYFQNRQRLFTWLPVAAGALYAFSPAKIASRLSTITSVQDSSNAYRLDTWNSTLSLLRDYWITGVGLGRRAFGRVYATHMINANYVPHAHNLYLQLMSEFGILGLTVFLWLIWRVFRLGCQLRTSASDFMRSLNAGVMGAGIGFLAHSVIDYFLWYYKLGILFWFIVGIILVLEKMYRLERT